MRLAPLSVTLATLAFLLLSTIAAAQPITFEKVYDYGLAEAANCVQQSFDGGYILAGRQGIAIGVMHLMLIKTDSQGNVEWEKFYGTGTNANQANAIRQTTDSGYIVCGYTTVPGMGDNVYLMRTDANGDTLWTRHYGTSLSDNGHDVRQTFDGGYIIAGQWADSLAMLIRTDANGDTLWTKTYLPPASNQSIAFSVDVTADSGFVLCGAAIMPGNMADVYVVRTDNSGNILWYRIIGGTYTESGEAVRQTTDGGYIIAGYTWSYGAGNYDVYLIRMDALGDTLWTRTFGDELQNGASSVQQTLDGGFIISGFTRMPQSTSYNAWIIKTDNSGNLIWERKHGGSKTEGAEYIIQTKDKGFAFCGMTNSFTNSPSVYFVKTDSTGSLVTSVAPYIPAALSDVSLYPNPFRETAILELSPLPAGNTLEAIVYDISGRPVKQIPLHGSRTLIYREGLPAGVYLLQVLDAGSVLGIVKVVIH